MRDVILLLIGAVIGFLVNLLSSALFPTIRLRYKHLALRYLSKTRKQLISPTFMPEKLTAGGLPIDLIILARGHFKPGHIQCSYDRTSIPLIPEFAQMKRNFISDWKKRLAKGENKLPYNSATYKLKEFNAGYREIVDGEEVPVLRLFFGPTDYFAQIVTDLNINNPIRENYARVASLAEHPVPQFASCFGVDLNLITKDGYLILTERSLQTYVKAGKIHNSVGEGLLRPTDGGRDGKVDPFDKILLAKSTNMWETGGVGSPQEPQKKRSQQGSAPCACASEGMEPVPEETARLAHIVCRPDTLCL